MTEVQDRYVQRIQDPMTTKPRDVPRLSSITDAKGKLNERTSPERIVELVADPGRTDVMAVPKFTMVEDARR